MVSASCIHLISQCTVFAYGQTGTGKTHTMTGNPADESQAGITPRAVRKIFEHLAASGAEHGVLVSYLELYNEELEETYPFGFKMFAAVLP